MRPGFPWTGLAFSAAFVTQATLAALPSTAIRDFPGVSVVMDTGDGACPATLPVTIRANKRDEFQQPRLLIRAMAWAQTTARTSCPDATAIVLTGTVNGETVYNAAAQRDESWRLVETPRRPSPDTASPVFPDALPVEPGPAAVSVPNPAPAPAAAPAPEPQRPVPDRPALAPRLAANVQQCDALAAHPDDPEAFAKGVSDDKLNAKAAIAACEAAVKADPSAPRLHFQLGRAYLKGGRFEDAAEQLLLAAEEAHGGALAYLADFHLGGAPGIEADPMLAKTLYEKALASGFQPAAAVLKEFEDMTEAFDRSELEDRQAASGGYVAPVPAPYKRPAVIEAILKDDLDGVSDAELWTKAYLYNIAESIGVICEKHFAKQQLASLKTASEIPTFSYSAQYQQNINLTYTFAKTADQFKDLARAMREAGGAQVDGDDITFQDSLNDAGSFLTRHSCTGPAIERFSKNIVKYIHSVGTLPSPPDALLRQCVKYGQPSRLKISEFCLCYAGAMDFAGVSRIWRNELLSPSFWTAAQTFFRHSPAIFRPCL